MEKREITITTDDLMDLRLLTDHLIVARDTLLAGRQVRLYKDTKLNTYLMYLESTEGEPKTVVLCAVVALSLVHELTGGQYSIRHLDRGVTVVLKR